MQQKIKKPLYKVLNESRTNGEIIIQKSSMYQSVVELLQGTNTFGQVCPLNAGNKTTNTQNVFNAEYTALAVNNFAEIADNLARLIDRIEENELQGNFPSAYKRAKEALNKIS